MILAVLVWLYVAAQGGEFVSYPPVRDGTQFVYSYAVAPSAAGTSVVTLGAMGPIVAVEAPLGWTASVTGLGVIQTIVWSATDGRYSSGSSGLVGFKITSPSPPGDVTFEFLDEQFASTSGTARGPVQDLPPSPDDTEAPIVTPPEMITVDTDNSIGAVVANSPKLLEWLRGGSAVDLVDREPTRLVPVADGAAVTAATTFSQGVTPVSFRFGDRAGNVGASTATVRVRVRPALEWARPAAIAEGTKIGALELSAKAPVPGAIEYVPRAGSLLNNGTHELSAFFTPADDAAYGPSQKAVPLDVLPVAGDASGAGVVEADGARWRFGFDAEQRASGVESGRLIVRSLPIKGGRESVGLVFEATRVTEVIFVSRRADPSEDDRVSVVVRGTGRLNGLTGYAFEVRARASGTGKPSGGSLSLSARDRDGTIRLAVDGEVASGNIRVRVR
jgi:hypothetical protein